MQRRGFLNLTLASAAAPAIVKADSLMKIWVPPQEIQFSGITGLTSVEEITRQSLELIPGNLYFMGTINSELEGGYLRLSAE